MELLQRNMIQNHLDKIRIIKTIGKGSYGTVYLCNSLKTHQLIVLKDIPVISPDDEKYHEAINEIKILSTLSHPFIIKYVESFCMQKSIYIVMEYAAHGNLAEFMYKKQHYLLPQHEILYYFCQILLGVQHMHARKIIHRDLKAENILLSGPIGNIVKIGDFGIAKILGNDKANTIVGTPYYLAPELCENKPYDLKTDVWALGCLLYEMCTHKRAFDSSTLVGLIKQITSGNVMPINICYYKRSIQSIIDKMLTIVPEKRSNINEIVEHEALKQTMTHIRNMYPVMSSNFCIKKHVGLYRTL